MVDFDRLITRFRQFGLEACLAICPYGGVVDGCCALIRCALKERSLKAAYPVITEKVDGILIRLLMMGAFRRFSGSPGCRVSTRLLIW